MPSQPAIGRPERRGVQIAGQHASAAGRRDQVGDDVPHLASPVPDSLDDGVDVGGGQMDVQNLDGLVWNIEQGLGLAPRDIARAEKLRSALWQRVRRFMERYDLLVLPTVAVRPFPVEQRYPTELNGKRLENYTQWFFLTYAISVTGLPAISVPAGFTRDGLPVGIQIVGRRRQETAVLKAAAAFEAAAPWTDRIPPVAAGLPRP